MKRQHPDYVRKLGENKQAIKGLIEEIAVAEVTENEWELKEDLFLKSLGCKSKLINWKQKCHEMNQALGISTHNAEECRMRHQFLVYAEEQNKWLPSEGLILLFCVHYARENWLKKEIQLLERHPEDTKKHFKHSLWLTAYQASTNSSLEEKTVSSAIILQIAFNIKILIETIKQSNPLPEALSAIKQFKLTEEQCINYLSQIKSFPKGKVNFSRLEDFLNSTFESINNSLNLFDTSVELRDIFHNPKTPTNEIIPAAEAQPFYEPERYYFLPVIFNQIPSSMVFYESFPFQYYS